MYPIKQIKNIITKGERVLDALEAEIDRLALLRDSLEYHLYQIEDGIAEKNDEARIFCSTDAEVRRDGRAILKIAQSF
jgi:hypothetical protein